MWTCTLINTIVLVLQAHKGSKIRIFSLPDLQKNFPKIFEKQLLQLMLDCSFSEKLFE